MSIMKIQWNVKSLKRLNHLPYPDLSLWIKGDREGFDWLDIIFKSPQPPFAKVGGNISDGVSIFIFYWCQGFCLAWTSIMKMQ